MLHAAACAAVFVVVVGFSFSSSPRLFFKLFSFDTLAYTVYMMELRMVNGRKRLKRHFPCIHTLADTRFSICATRNRLGQTALPIHVSIGFIENIKFGYC